MSWEKDSIIIKSNFNEAFDRYYADKATIDGIVDIQFSMGEFGKRAAEIGESLSRLSMVLKASCKRDEPSFAALSQFVQKDGEKEGC